MTEKEIQNKIDDLKKEMAETKGTRREVYSRVCGYLRPVQNWNKGKQEEFGLRKTMTIETLC